MTTGGAAPGAVNRYGPAGFFAALGNVLVLGSVTAVFAGPYIVFVGPPLLVVDAGIAFALSRGRGRAAQMGWGMLIGCVAVLVSVVLGVAVFAVAKAL